MKILIKESYHNSYHPKMSRYNYNVPMLSFSIALGALLPRQLLSSTACAHSITYLSQVIY
jgi:hypothetical protein